MRSKHQGLKLRFEVVALLCHLYNFVSKVTIVLIDFVTTCLLCCVIFLLWTEWRVQISLFWLCFSAEQLFKYITCLWKLFQRWGIYEVTLYCNTALVGIPDICLCFYQYYIHIECFNYHAVAMAIILPLSLPFIHTDTCTGLLLMNETCIAASNVPGTCFGATEESVVVSVFSLTGPMLAVAERSSATIYIAKYSYQLDS